MPILLDLFLTFFKLGLFTFGGGYAMIPLLTDEVIAHGWLAQEEIMNFIAVSESTPGPIAINMATFIGVSQGGVLGAILATLGVVLPSFIIILLIASIVTGLMKYAGVKAFLQGIRPVVIGLILATGITMLISVVIGLQHIGQKAIFDWKALVIFAIIELVHVTYKKIRKKALSPIVLILVSAGLGMIFYVLIP